MREVDSENERLRQEILRMTKYISEQESAIEHHREKIREVEIQNGHHIEQHRVMDAHIEK